MFEKLQNKCSRMCETYFTKYPNSCCNVPVGDNTRWFIHCFLISSFQAFVITFIQQCSLTNEQIEELKSLSRTIEKISQACLKIQTLTLNPTWSVGCHPHIYTDFNPLRKFEWNLKPLIIERNKSWCLLSDMREIKLFFHLIVHSSPIKRNSFR